MAKTETKNNKENPPQKKKKRLILKFLHWPILILLFFVSILTVYWLIDKQSIRSYLTHDARALVEIKSVSDLALKTLDNKNLSKFISNIGLGDVSSKIFELRKQLSNSRDLFSALLDVPIYLQVSKKNDILLIIDSGWRGVFLQLAPIFGSLFNVDGLEMSKTIVAGRTVFAIKISADTSFYICYDKGNLLASMSLSGIEDAFLTEKESSLQIKEEDLEAFSKIESHDIAIGADFTNLVSKTGTGTIGQLIKTIPDLKNGMMGVNFGQSIQINSHFSYTQTKEFSKIFDQSGRSKILDYLPESTQGMSIIRISNLRPLFDLSQKMGIEGLPNEKSLDDILKTAFGMTFNDFIFSWSGHELITAFVEKHSSPILGIEIGDSNALKNVILKMNNSGLLKFSETYTVDGVQLTRILIPDLWKSLAKWFGVELELPWMVSYKDLLLISDDPSAIAQWINELKAQKVLIGKTSFLNSFKDSSQLSGDIILYFDGQKKAPAFLKALPFFEEISSSFSTNFFSVDFQEKGALAYFQLSGISNKGISLMEGYPKPFEFPPTGDFITGKRDIILANLLEGSNPELLYIDQNNRIVIANINGKALKTQDAIGMRLLYGDSNIINSDSKGKIQILSNDLLANPTNIETQIYDAFPLILDRKNLYGFSDIDRSILNFQFDGNKSALKDNLDLTINYLEIINSKFLYGLSSSPLGEAIVLNIESDNLPFKTYETEHQLISPALYFENGAFALCSHDGHISIYPQIFTDEAPVILDTKKIIKVPPINIGNDIVFYSEDGNLYIIAQDGEIKNERPLQEIYSPEAIMTYDPFQKQILISSKNEIHAFNRDLSKVEGFPLIGQKPYLVDLDGDGKKEILTTNAQGEILIYENL